MGIYRWVSSVEGSGSAVVVVVVVHGGLRFACGGSESLHFHISLGIVSLRTCIEFL